MSDAQRPWWLGAVGYEVYIRSFLDTDGDGVGDLGGIRARVDYLAELGVDIVWVTPFYPSPQLDHGYDVADYRDVDPVFGDLAEFDRLVEDAHAHGMRLLIDVVPNHTSSRHRWFEAARSGRDDPHRDYYIWRDPAPDGGPPNNWVSHFGGPAWTYDDATAQYWLHLFLPEQPDLNWANPAVADEFDDILRFWLDRGVDGFRIDVAHALVKDPELRDNPLTGDAPRPDAPSGEVFAAYEHVHDMDQAGVLDVYRRWRALASRYDALLLGEVYLLDPAKVARYVRDGDALHLALCIPSVKTSWDAGVIRTTLREGVRHGGGSFAWPAASHDDAHAATRFGGSRVGRERALAYLTLLLGLPGVPFLFQGDELGLENGRVRPEHARDPVAVREGGDPRGGRDGVRTPMPWTPDEPHMGFTRGDPWLPPGPRAPEDSMTNQRARAGSYLHRTRGLIHLRRGCDDLHGDAEIEWLTDHGPLVAYRRGDTIVVANCGTGVVPIPLPAGEWRLLFESGRGVCTASHTSADTVSPDTALVLAAVRG